MGIAQPQIITGNIYKDERGTLVAVNDFDMLPVKRFYTILHPDTLTIRAWQGHIIEQKWFFVLAGAFKVLLVQPDNWSTPSPKLPVKEYILSTEKSEVLHIPGGFVNGFKALAPYSRMVVYSDMNLEDSKRDDYRFDKDLWYHWGE